MIYGEKYFQNYQKMLKMKKWIEILENSPQYLFLASGVKNGEGFWFVGVKNCDESILEDKKIRTKKEYLQKEKIGKLFPKKK